MLKIFKIFLNIKYAILNFLNRKEIKARNDSIRESLKLEAVAIIQHFKKSVLPDYTDEALFLKFKKHGLKATVLAEMFVNDYVNLYYQDLVDEVDSGDAIRYFTFYKYFIIRKHPIEMERLTGKYRDSLNILDYLAVYDPSTNKKVTLRSEII